MNIKSFIKNLAFLASASLAMVLVPGFANAAVDVSSAVSSISTDGTSAITAIGTALIALAGIALVFRWAKASLF